MVGAAVELMFFVKDFRFADIMNWSIFRTLLELGVTGNMMILGYIWSAEYTIMSHASIFNSLGGAFIVFGSLLLRKYVHNLEIAGTLVATFGCIIILFDSNAEKVNAEQ